MTEVNTTINGHSDRQNKPLALVGENLRSEYFEKKYKDIYTILGAAREGRACLPFRVVTRM